MRINWWQEKFIEGLELTVSRGEVVAPDAIADATASDTEPDIPVNFIRATSKDGSHAGAAWIRRRRKNRCYRTVRVFSIVRDGDHLRSRDRRSARTYWGRCPTA